MRMRVVIGLHARYISMTAVIPNNPSRALKYPLDKHLYVHAIC